MIYGSDEHTLTVIDIKLKQIEAFENMYTKARLQHIQCHCLACRPELPDKLNLTIDDISDDFLLKDKRKLLGVNIY